MRAARVMSGVISFVAVAVGALAFYRPLVEVLLFHARRWILSGPAGDEWLYVYFFRVELEKLFGIDQSGMWNGQFYYPLHDVSLLLTEPQWGVTVALAPVWWMVRDEFLTLSIGAVAALALGWVSAYAFARHLGASRVAAGAAAAAFGTTTSFLMLLIRPFFWSFCVVVGILWAVDGVCLSRRRGWIVALAGGFGVLAWLSCHLSVMAGVFAIAQAGFCFYAGIAAAGALRRLAIAGAFAAVLVAIPFVPQHLALRDHGFERTLDAQSTNAANLSSFVGTPTSTLGGALGAHMAPPTGEVIVGLPPIAVLVATIAFCVALARARVVDPRRRLRVAVETAIAGAAGGVVALAMPERLGARVIDAATTATLYATLAMVIVLLRRRLGIVLRTPAGWFFACALGFAMLSVGPFFTTEAGAAVPSPALLVCQLPGLSGIRASARWSIVCAFALAVSTAFALEAIGRPRLRLLAGVAVVALLLADAWSAAQRSAASFPAAVATWTPRPIDELLKELPGEGAVLELPVSAREPEGPRMFSRLHHRRPLVNGYAGMIPEFFRDHWVAPDAELRARGRLGDANVASLRAFGARYWVLHRDELAPGVRASIPSAFGPLKKIREIDGGAVVVYEDPDPRPEPPAAPR